MPKFAKKLAQILKKIASGWGCALDSMVTGVCLYIYTLLAYERVLEKCFWVPAKVLEIFVTKSVGTLYVNLHMTLDTRRRLKVTDLYCVSRAETLR